MAVVEKPKAAIGAPLGRKEDAELLTGQARFVDDLTLPGMVWMAVVRSPYAHARIRSVDVSRALAATGVVAVFSGADLAEDVPAGLPCVWPVTEDIALPTHWPLARDKARFAGDGVAVVIAETRALAKDAAELVDFDYEPLEAVTDVEAALAQGAPLVHEEFGTNRCYAWALAAGEVDKAFADAAVTVSGRYRQNRLVPNAIEPRGVLVQPVPAQGEYTLWSATQIPHILRVLLAMTLGIPEAKLRVIAPDVGGGFGSKLNVYAEEQLALALARKLGRPIKWIEERSEAYVATMGSYLQLVTPGIPLLGAWLYGGAYDVQAYDFSCTGVFTNTTPVDAYRGAGRPESTYAIERTIDKLARRLGKDPVEVRRLNFLDEFPATMASGLTIDAADFHATLDRALETLDYDALRREQAERRERGDVRQLGVGFSTYVEMCGLAPSRILGSLRYAGGGWDTATIRCLPTGTVQVLTGTSPHGQSHATTWAQIAADRLGVPYENVEVLHGDTAVVPLGMDTYGSRSLAVGGVALWHAAQRIKEKARV